MTEARNGWKRKEGEGRFKQAGGAITGDKKLQREGKRDECVGSLENKADDVTDAVHDKVDEVIEKVSHEM
jgi:uncharacterized protein YjbJ (UPF0337 family)